PGLPAADGLRRPSGPRRGGGGGGPRPRRGRADLDGGGAGAGLLPGLLQDHDRLPASPPGARGRRPQGAHGGADGGGTAPAAGPGGGTHAAAGAVRDTGRRAGEGRLIMMSLPDRDPGERPRARALARLDLSNAYARLGVSPLLSTEEIKAAVQRKRKELMRQ